jgi:hypothetical protein
VDTLKFYLVDLGLPKKVAVVAEAQLGVSQWAKTKCATPKVSVMTDSQRKRWRGATIYLDEVAKGSPRESR